MPRHSIFSSLLFLFFILATTPLAAGVDKWTVHGPEGVPVGDVVMHPTAPITYIATWRGVFKQDHRPGSWTAIYPDNSVARLALAQSDPETLFAVVRGSTVVRSTNGGSTWVERTPVPNNRYPRVLEVDPTDRSRLYLATNEGLYKSLDGGWSWHLLDRFEACLINDLSIDPTSPSTVYMSVSAMSSPCTQGLSKSTDGGLTWMSLENTLPRAPGLAVEVAPSEPSTVYASLSVGIFKSSDAGSTWEHVSSNHAGRRLAVSATNHQIVLAGGDTPMGPWRTDDGGTTWRSCPFGPHRAFATSVQIDSSDPDRMIAGTTAGVLLADTACNAWQTANRGLGHTEVDGLLIDPTNPDVLFADTRFGGLYRSQDRGASWHIRGSGIPGNTSLTQIVADPLAPTTLYAAYSSGVAKSVDGGETFSPVNQGLMDSGFFRSLAIDPFDSQTLYVADSGRGVYKSTDGAASWSLPSSDLDGIYFDDIVTDPTQPGALYVLHFNGEPAVYRSTDAGVSWSPAGNGLPSSYLLGLALDPNQGGRLYATTFSDGLYTSEDSGFSWSLRNPSTVMHPVFDPTKNSTMYFVIGQTFDRDGVHLSTDGGTTSRLFGDGLHDRSGFHTLALDPVDGRTLFVTSSRGGIYILQRSDAFFVDGFPTGDPSGWTSVVD